MNEVVQSLPGLPAPLLLSGAAVALVVAALFGAFAYRRILEKKVAGATRKADAIVVDAEKRAKQTLREAALQNKNELYELRREFEKESRDRKRELSALDRRLVDRRLPYRAPLRSSAHPP